MKTVFGLFSDVGQARSAIGGLSRIGLSRNTIGLLSSAKGESQSADMSLLELPDIGKVSANAPMLELLRSRGGIAGALEGLGVSKSDAQRCIELIRRGGTLEAVTIEDNKEADALAIMQQYSSTEPKALDRERDLVIPVIDEELEIGKREIDAGGVRVSTHVTAVPVEKTVTVREEHIRVERRTVDRPIDDRDEVFRDQSIEMKASSEEPVVAKRTHVVEEIRVHKDSNERVQTIQDKVRHTDVSVSEIPAADMRIRRKTS